MYATGVMETRNEVPAVEGWFTTGPNPRLIGSRCLLCHVTAFPPRPSCPNPICVDGRQEAVELPPTGEVWSYTDAQYQPPPPYESPSDPYEPFVLAAVAVDEVQIVVLGQMVGGLGVDDMYIGMPVELVVELLRQTPQVTETMWRWKPSKETRNA